jgi:hypothetical protein
LVLHGNAPSLLGKEAAEALGILQVGLKFVEDKSVDSRTESILAQYPGITDGIGCLKDVEVKLHIDKSIPPVARKHNRVPFHLREKVEKEIEWGERY